MAIKLRVQNKFQIIVPVRVDRAVRGAPQLDAPDVDDRGWVRNTAAGLNVTDARGALFSMTVGEVARLRVVREDLDSTVDLFVTTTGNQVEIAAPAGGGPLPATGIFSVRAVSDNTTGSKVQVRLGSASGPVACEADAHTFTRSTIPLAIHVCTVHSASAVAVAAGGGTGSTPSVNGNTLNDAQVTAIFDTIVRPIWRPAGVDFAIGAVQQEVFNGTNGFTRDNVALQGTAQLKTVFARNRKSNQCNIFLMHTTDRFLGLGLDFDSRAILGANNSGILIGVNGFLDGAGTFNARGSAGADLVHEIGNDLAHEIGHFLNLPHADLANSPAVATDPPPRHDTYNRRFLMHPNNLLPAAVTNGRTPRSDDVGYGRAVDASGNALTAHRGCLLTLKNHPGHRSDGEVVTARQRLKSPNLLK